MELEGKKISVCFCASSIDVLLIGLHAILIWFIDNHEEDVMLEFLYYAVPNTKTKAEPQSNYL